MVRVESLDFGYVKSAPLTLHDVNLNLEAGAMLTILGQNGAGKSTLLNLISGTLTPLRGQISIDGKDMASLSAKGRAEIIGYVSQSEVCEYDYSVFEYVLMGRTAHIGIFSQPSENDYKLAQRYMKMLEIWHLKDKIITRLSGGQRQMASIARAHLGVRLCQPIQIPPCHKRAFKKRLHRSFSHAQSRLRAAFRRIRRARKRRRRSRIRQGRADHKKRNFKQAIRSKARRQLQRKGRQGVLLDVSILVFTSRTSKARPCERECKHSLHPPKVSEILLRKILKFIGLTSWRHNSSLIIEASKF